jgi:hypothetical protein
MKTKSRSLLTLFGIMLCVICYSQDNAKHSIQFQEASLESKHEFAAWRVDWYICTGIAYAKSMGQSVEDFAEFVGKHHGLGNPKTATLATVAYAGHTVLTSYPGGTIEIISESDSVLVFKCNRPYKDYYKNGPMLGVTLDEFERYFWGHVAIMAGKLNMDYKYEIKEDEIISTLSYKKQH